MKQYLLKIIRVYQQLPKGRPCRFIPTCSEYAYQAVNRYGIVRGCLLGIKRVLKCHPWSKGGIDNVV